MKKRPNGCTLILISLLFLGISGCASDVLQNSETHLPTTIAPNALAETAELTEPLEAVTAIATEKPTQMATAVPTQTEAAGINGPIQIQFLDGMNLAEVEGEVIAGKSTEYRLEASAGQHLSITVFAPNSDVVFVVSEPSGSSLGTVTADRPMWQGQLPAAGDYLISLSSVGGDTGYLMQVILQN